MVLVRTHRLHACDEISAPNKRFDDRKLQYQTLYYMITGGERIIVGESIERINRDISTVRSVNYQSVARVPTSCYGVNHMPCARMY